MDFRNFIAGENDSERRLDRVIRLFLKETSLSEIYKLIRKGFIKVNDKKTNADLRVKQGDKISVAEFLFSSNLDRQIKSEDELLSPNRHFLAEIDIKKITVFQNEHILVLEKPYDMKVHGDENSLDAAVKKYYAENFSSAASTSLSFTPGPLHRLDRKTTGLIAFSMSLKGAKWFSENIKSHRIRKIYRGIVLGNMTETERWEDFISKNNDISLSQKSVSKKINEKSVKVTASSSFKTVKISKSQSEPNGKLSVTTATPLKHGKYNNTDITLVEFEIETGRTHQIRSQSSFHGFPLFGDTAYGGKKITRAKNDASPRDFYLHAAKLLFPENDIGLPPEIISAPNDFPL